MHRGAILAVQGSLSRGAILGLDNIGWSDVMFKPTVFFSPLLFGVCGKVYKTGNNSMGEGDPFPLGDNGHF